MKLLKIKVNSFGGAPVATHNMPCAICRLKHAVIDLSSGRFGPCWSCQKEGWFVSKLQPMDPLGWLFRKWFI